MCEKLARGLAYVGFFLMPMFSLWRVYRNLSVSDVVLAGAFLLFLACRPGKVLFSILRNPLNLSVAVFLVGFLLTFVMTGTVPGQAVESLFSLAQLLFCIYAVTTVLFFCDVNVALGSIALSVAVLGVAAVLFLGGILDIGSAILVWDRLSIADVDPNVAARIFFVGAVVLCFHWRKLIAWMLSSVTVFCWLVTFSRSGLLALGALVLPVFRKRPVFSIAVAAVVCCGLLFVPLGGSSSSSFSVYSGRVSEAVRLADVNTTSRLTMIRQGVEIISQSPFVGVGMGVFPEGVGAVHNAFIGTGVETGLLGMFSLLAMYLIVFQIARRLESRFGMLGVLVVGTLLFDLFMSVSQNRIFWLPFSLVLALYLQRLAGSGHRPPSAHALTSNTR